MMHPDIERDDVVERYIRRELALDDERAFEDHFFACDECFAKVQAAERFRAGVRDAARRGLLDAAPAREAGSWLRWAFGAAACAAVVLAGLAGWMQFHELPALREALARSTTQIELERQARATLTGMVDAANAPEANVPIAMLVATRSGDSLPAVTLAPNDRRLVLWVDIGPARFKVFRMLVADGGGRQVAAFDRLELNAQGALVAILPADKLPAGEVRITLSGEAPPPAALVGEYQLRISRR